MDETQFGKGAADRPGDYFGDRAWRHEEISMAPTPVKWVEKTAFKTYPKKNQGTSGSCTTQALAKQLSVDELSENGEYRELSARSIYPYVVVPGGGSNSIVATKHAVKFGITLESLLSPALTEEGMVSDKGYLKDAKIIAQVYKPESFIECATDFETIASIIQKFRDDGKEKVITATVIGKNNGTWQSEFPKTPAGQNEPGLWYHRIVITDYGMIGGKKVLAIDNSWGENIGRKGQQFLTEEYVPYMYGGIYTLNKPDDWQIQTSTVVPPVYTWTKDLHLGSQGPDVVALQQALQSMGMFPLDKFIKPSGNYYGITQKAVEIFQSTFGIPVTGKVDATTRAKLNEIF